MNTKTISQAIVSGFIILTFIFPSGVISAQAEPFTEPFDDPSLPDWEHSPGIFVEDGFLRIEPGNFAAHGGDWGELLLSIRMRIMGEGDLALSYRVSGSGGYHLLVNPQRVALQREVEGVVVELASTQVSVPGEEWIHFQINAQEGRQTAHLNGELILAVEDPQPLPPGGIAFETLVGIAVDVDNIEVVPFGSSQEATEVEEAAPSPSASTTQITSQEAIAGQSAYLSIPWIYTGGPPGGLGYDIRMDPRNPDVMYVTDAFSGAFKSLDGGKTWFAINNGISTRAGSSGDAIPVFSLSIDPNNPDRLWLGTQFKSDVFRSDDGGKNWMLMTEGIEEWGLSVRGLTVQPGNSDVVYFAAEVSSHEWNNEQPRDCFGLDMTKGVVYKSADAGQHWTRIWQGDNLVRYVWVHPSDPNLLFVSTGIFDRCAANGDPETLSPGGLGVLRSRDGGQTWEVLGVENGFDPEDLYIGSLFMHPDNPNILLAAAGDDLYSGLAGHPMGGIYLSNDAGDHWTEVLDGLNFSAVEVCVGDPNVIYAGALSGFYRSEDGGFTWAEIAGSHWGSPGIIAGFPIDMQCDPRDSMRIFVNNYNGGNFLSEDGGETWVDASRGYSGAMMAQIALVQTDPRWVYVSSRGGFFATQDGGNNWVGLGTGVVRTLEGLAMAVDPYDPNHILGSLVDAGPFPKVSFDAGNTWQGLEPEMLGGGQPGMIASIFFAPLTPDLLLGAIGRDECWNNRICLAEAGARGIIRSTDGGQTWSKTNLTSGSAIAVASFPGDDALWYTFAHPDGLYRSNDHGATWNLVNANPLPEAFIALEMLDETTPAILSLAVDPTDANRLYAGLHKRGFAISRDGGETWELSAAGLPSEASVMDIQIDQTNPSLLYIASPESGVFYSIDQGQTWQDLNDGLSTRAAKHLALSADGSVLYVNTEGAGVFRLGIPPEAPQAAVSIEPEETHTVAPQVEPVVSTSEPVSPTEAPLKAQKPGICGGVFALPAVLAALVMWQRRKSFLR